MDLRFIGLRTTRHLISNYTLVEKIGFPLRVQDTLVWLLQLHCRVTLVPSCEEVRGSTSSGFSVHLRLENKEEHVRQAYTRHTHRLQISLSLHVKTIQPTTICADKRARSRSFTIWSDYFFQRKRTTQLALQKQSHLLWKSMLAFSDIHNDVKFFTIFWSIVTFVKKWVQGKVHKLRGTSSTSNFENVSSFPIF